MDKTIKLIMNTDKSIAIYKNDNHKLTIMAENRQITAQNIYNILDFKPGEVVHVECDNPHEIDIVVLNELKALFEDIIKEIKGIKSFNESMIEDEALTVLDEALNK